jgi:hypothetical protein
MRHLHICLRFNHGWILASVVSCSASAAQRAGGASPLRQLMAFKEHKPSIVVATPGRLLQVGTVCYFVLCYVTFAVAADGAQAAQTIHPM